MKCPNCSHTFEAEVTLGTRAHCARVTFPWNGVKWEVDYLAVADGDDYRGRSLLVSASRIDAREGQPVELTADEARAMTTAHPGELERKASGWAKKLLFGADHGNVKVRRMNTGADPRLRTSAGVTPCEED